ncbi:MAG: GGDEF domain-containing protein [Acidiferrobacterales bacterium]
MDAEGDSGNIIDSIRTQLEGLKRTEDGSLLYRLIERGLGKRPEDNASTDEAFLTFMYTLLERYAKNRDGDPITRIKVRVIQQRITPYLMHEEETDEQPGEATATGEIVGEPESAAAEAEPEVVADEPVAEVIPEVAEEKTIEEAEPAVEKNTKEKSEPEPVVETPSENPKGSAPEEFDLELISPDEIDRELQAEEEKKPPLEGIEKPVPPKQETKNIKPAPQKTKPKKPKPVEAKSEQKIEAKSPPAQVKKKPVKVKPKPKAPEKKPAAVKKPEPVKKPVKLELVEPTDLTKPHAPKEVAKNGGSDEGYIDLGDDVPTPARPGKSPQAMPAAQSASRPKVKTSGSPDTKSAQPKQQLMPKGSSSKAVESRQEPKSGEPSQERVEKLHEAFVHKMAESITRSQEYHRMLRSQMKKIELADSGNDFRDLKSLLMKGLEELLKGNETLGRDLDSTSHYLKIARLDRALLKDELGRIKNNTTIDELTALQNKEAFVKQLESEISRVNRYGFSFAIAVLDIDDLKSINTTYGRDAGDEVLRCYARQILSQFRSYDLVARNRSDEFLLLFPNTQKEGALRAVEKAQKRAANLYINHKDKNIKVPTFTSVLTTYTPGDQPDTILRRTTEALVQAQRHGRDQVILALPTS